MGDLGPTPASLLTASELARIVREVDIRAFVVPGRVVRRAIQHDRGLSKLVLRVPHRMAFTLSSSVALEVVDRDELGLEPGESLPPTLILLAEPEGDELLDRPGADVLRDYWRRLFHARVDIEMGRRFESGSIGPLGLRERIRRIDPSAFEEARSVLGADNLLLPPIDDRVVYVEFAAVYLGLRAFNDHLIPRFFPAIRDYDAVDRTLAEDLDADALLAATRLPGFERVVGPEPTRAHRAGEPRRRRARPRAPLRASIPALDGPVGGGRGPREPGPGGDPADLGGPTGRVEPGRPGPVGGPGRDGQAREPAQRPRSGSTRPSSGSGGRPWSSRWSGAPGASGRPRPGCSMTSRRSASTTSGRFTRSTSSVGRPRWAGGRSSGSCRTTRKS